jgi:predicted transcriptional regulator
MKKAILELFKLKSYLTLSEIHKLAEKLNHKQSTVERVMRKLCEGNIEAHKDNRGFIVGYTKREVEHIEKEKKPTAQTLFNTREYYRS